MPFCKSCKDVALGNKDPRAVREAGADRGGRNLAGEDDEDDEAESVDDDEASSSAAIAEERVGGEPHVPPAAATPAAPAPAPANCSAPARRLVPKREYYHMREYFLDAVPKKNCKKLDGRKGTLSLSRVCMYVRKS